MSLAHISYALLALALFLCLMIGFGWIFHIPWLIFGFQRESSLKFNSALSIASLSVAAHIIFRGQSHPTRLVGLLLAVPLGIGAISLLESLSHLSLHIDDIFGLDTYSAGSRWAAGRPSPVTSINLILLGASLFSLNNYRGTIGKNARWLVLFSWIICFQSLVSYVENVNDRFGLALYSQMSFYTSLCFACIATAILLRDEDGIMRILSGRMESNRITRILIFFAIFLPPTISWIQIGGEKLGLWNAESGSIIRILCQVTVSAWVAMKAGSTLFLSELKELEAQRILRRAIASRDEFLSIASHELKTPIAGLKLHAQLLGRNLEKKSDQFIDVNDLKKFIARTDHALNRLNHLVDDMLDISRIENGKLSLNTETLSLSAFLDENLARFLPQLAEASIPIESDWGRADVLVQIDRYRMEQVVTNLLTNVVRYAPESTLKIRLDFVENHARVIFQDTGPGIAPENHERIFERFERLVSASERSGLGLGLFISRQIVRHHGGELLIESALDEGSRFIIDLPIAPP